MSWKVGSIAIVLVLALCTAGAASALPLDPEAEAPGRQGGGMWAWLFDWLGRITGGEEDSLSALELDGCHIDPNGACFNTH